MAACDVGQLMNANTRLAANALGLGESVIMGIAGTAPAFSAAAATATLIAAVGVLSPASLLYCGAIMFGVTLAFKELNRVDPNAGASYAWVEKAFGPVLGFLAGWSLLVASALFMVTGTVPAATAYSIPSFDLVTNIMGLGGIVIGVVPLFLNHFRLARKGSGAGR